MIPDKGTLIVLLLGSAIAGVAGWTANGWRYETKLSTLKSDHATAEAKAAKDHAEVLAKANARGDRLLVEKAAMENTHNETLREKNNEIARLTTGRRCLDARVVGVLNRDGTAPNGRPASQAAGVPVRTDGTAAAGADDGQETARKDSTDTGEEQFATDADVAGWIALCRTRYDICRGDRDRIRRFYDAPDIGGRFDE